MPVSASIAGQVVTVIFDRSLNPAALDAGNWSVRYASTRYSVASAVVGGPGNTQVAVTLQTPGAPEGGGNRVWYAPPPFDVVGSPNLQPVAAFGLAIT